MYTNTEEGRLRLDRAQKRLERRYPLDTKPPETEVQWRDVPQRSQAPFAPEWPAAVCEAAPSPGTPRLIPGANAYQGESGDEAWPWGPDAGRNEGMAREERGGEGGGDAEMPDADVDVVDMETEIMQLVCQVGGSAEKR